jgi:hypothetical protein
VAIHSCKVKRGIHLLGACFNVNALAKKPVHIVKSALCARL